MEDLHKLAEKVIKSAADKGILISVAESITGGMVATALTSVEGASDSFDRGFITYSYEAKAEMLDVSKNTLYNYDAISRECAEEMAMGAIKNSHSHIAISTTGLAGPGTGSSDKPVGTVYIGNFNKKKNSLKCDEQLFSGDRMSIRQQTVKRALELLLEMIEAN